MRSAYFPHEEAGSLPPETVIKLAEHCHRKGLPLIVGCNANAHHTIWRSTDINNRSRRLLDYLVATDLETLNRGNEPTFQNMLRREVLDIILCSRNLVSEVVGWRVSSKPSLFDHKQIVFRLANVRAETINKRNPRRTNWDSFRKDLSTSFCGFPKRHGTNAGLKLCVDHL